ncbi:DUF4331 domain-containing protein [soil metagenome]
MRRDPRLLVGGSLIALLAATGAVSASSHAEAPAIAGKPRVDGTDFYMFRSYEPGRRSHVTMIANYYPIQFPGGGPSYFTLDNDAVYEIHVDNSGNAREDLTFQFRFQTELANGGDGISLNIDGEDVAIPLRQAGPILEPGDATINERESFSMWVTEGDRRTGERRRIRGTNGDHTFLKPIDNIGNKTLPEYSDYAEEHIYNVSIPGCQGNSRVFVGQRADAFAINLGEIFDLVNFVPIEGDSAPGAGDGGGFPGGITQERANDDVVDRFNVTSIAIEVPINCLTGDGNGVIGAWTTSSLPQASLLDPSPAYNDTAIFGGALVQQSRLSAPLVNEVVIGLPDKDLFNAAEPTQDGALATYVTNPSFPALLDLLFRDAVNQTLGTDIDNLAPSNFPRNDLVAAFLTGFAGLNQQATVTPSEMMRLNTAVPVTPRGQQSTFGVAGGDVAGFPNGRRPGDDVVDISTRVLMGALCHDLPIGEALGLEDNNVNLGLCDPEDAPVGNVPFTDGAPISAAELKNYFPYLNDPLPGSPSDAN